MLTVAELCAVQSLTLTASWSAACSACALSGRSAPTHASTGASSASAQSPAPMKKARRRQARCGTTRK
jgi:hypothetical protein